MLKVRADLGFAEKTLAGYNVVYQVRTYDLDGYLTAKGRTLASQVDLTHTTHVDATDQVVVSKMLKGLMLAVVNQTVLLFHWTVLLSHAFAS
jgi:hypothetical protein